MQRNIRTRRIQKKIRKALVHSKMILVKYISFCYINSIFSFYNIQEQFLPRALPIEIKRC